MELTELNWIGLNRIELIWIESKGIELIEFNWLGWIEFNWLNWIEFWLNWIELRWLSWNELYLNWIELDLIESDWIELNWLNWMSWVDMTWIELNSLSWIEWMEFSWIELSLWGSLGLSGDPLRVSWGHLWLEHEFDMKKCCYHIYLAKRDFEHQRWHYNVCFINIGQNKVLWLQCSGMGDLRSAATARWFLADAYKTGVLTTFGGGSTASAAA